MEELINQIFAWILLIGCGIFTYIGIHMAAEKDAGKGIPLIWEKGGILYNLLNRKSK